MMGDREKCLQAQMDEYLSKPLQQNQLIQTILKCATLSGQLFDMGRERELAIQADAKSTSYNPSDQALLLRPVMENRSLTNQEPLTGAAGDRSHLLAANDYGSRARHELAEMRSLSS